MEILDFQNQFQNLPTDSTMHVHTNKCMHTFMLTGNRICSLFVVLFFKEVKIRMKHTINNTAQSLVPTARTRTKTKNNQTEQQFDHQFMNMRSMTRQDKLLGSSLSQMSVLAINLYLLLQL